MISELYNYPNELRITNAPTPALDLARSYQQEDRGKYPFKPNGLWYSFNNDWLRWCRSDDHKNDWIYPYNFKLEFDHSRLLHIMTAEALYGFNSLFGLKTKLSTPSGGAMTIGVDWKKVTEQYAGIEFVNYHSIHADSLYKVLGEGFNVNWYRSLSLDSGCVWDLSVIKNVEAITEEQSFNDAQINQL